MVQEAPWCKDTEHARSLWTLRRGLVRRLARLAVLQWSLCLLVVLCLFPACLHQLGKNMPFLSQKKTLYWRHISLGLMNCNIERIWSSRISTQNFHTIHEYFLNKPHLQESTSSLDTSWTSTHPRIPHHHWKIPGQGKPRPPTFHPHHWPTSLTKPHPQNSTPSLNTSSKQTPPPKQTRHSRN